MGAFGSGLRRAAPVLLEEPEAQETIRLAPRWHVVLLDDDAHTYSYVIEMLRVLFGYPEARGYLLAREVDLVGRVIVDTTTRERAELKRDQIHAYGSDARIPRCKGSMTAILEVAS